MRAVWIGLLGAMLGISGAGAAESVRAKAAIACAEKVRTTADTRACWIAQIDRANQSLNQEYEAFLTAVRSEEPEDPQGKVRSKRATLVAAQADWVKYHLSHCNLYLGVFEGSMWHPVSDQCVLGKVEERLKDLIALRRDYQQ